MRIGEIFQLKADILSVRSQTLGHRIPMIIPAGAIITVAEGNLDDLRMVSVLWDGVTAMVFSADLRIRSAPHKSLAA